MTDPVATPGPGRPPVLDEAKRKRIIALLANGSSRRIAAPLCGLCPKHDHAHRSPRSPIRGGVRPTPNAMPKSRPSTTSARPPQNERYWRAAASLLERRNPEDFAERQPNAATEEQVRQAVVALADVVLEGLSEERYHEILQRLANLVGINLAEWDEPIHADSLPPPVTDGGKALDGATHDPFATRDACQSTPSTDRDFATARGKSPNRLGEQPATQVDDSPAPARDADDATEMQP